MDFSSMGGNGISSGFGARDVLKLFGANPSLSISSIAFIRLTCSARSNFAKN